MKPVKNLVFAAVLVFSIAFNTLAGDIDHPGEPAPPPLHMTTVSLETNTENQETPVETADYSFLEALVALLSVY